MTEASLTVGISGLASLLVALCVLIGVVVKMRGESKLGREQLVEEGTSTLLLELRKSVDEVKAENKSLGKQMEDLKQQFEGLKTVLREKMRAVGRVLFYIDRHAATLPDLEPIRNDLEYLREDGVVPYRWETAPTIQKE